MGFPGGLVVESPPANAEVTFSAVQEDLLLPQAADLCVAQLLSPCCRAWEPQLKPADPTACALKQEKRCREACAPQLEKRPHAATRGKPAQQGQHSQKQESK